jgi:hypothetical protein
MRLLVCNVGWMNRYQGLASGDRIQGGGTYVSQHEHGHEVCNFAPVGTSYCGYVQPAQGGKITLERLGAKNHAQGSISGVTVIWTATRPQGGSVVVGWYKDAVVYREVQKLKALALSQRKNNVDGYFIEASISGSSLLAPDQRTLEVPRKVPGGMGQANVWYPDARAPVAFISGVKRLVAGKSRPPRGTKANSIDPKRNAKVEAAAIAASTKYYRSIGFRIRDVQKDNLSWDFEAIGSGRKLFVEVKGLSAVAGTVGLTPNEYGKMLALRANYRLCIVSEALSNPKLHVFAHASTPDRWEDQITEGRQLEVREVKAALATIIA